MKIVLFGPPGAGKTTLGRIIEANHAYRFWDADQIITPEERKVLRDGSWTEDSRRALMERVVREFRTIAIESERVVVAAALTRQWMRDYLEQECGPVNFVLVRSLLDEHQMYRMITGRFKEGHPVSPESHRQLTKEFEPPQMPHWILENPHLGTDQRQLITNVRLLITQLEKRYE